MKLRRSYVCLRREVTCVTAKKAGVCCEGPCVYVWECVVQVVGYGGVMGGIGRMERGSEGVCRRR